MPAGMAAGHLVVTKEIRRHRQAPVRLHAPEAARRGVATDAEPSDSSRLAAAQRWARLGDLPARPGYFEVRGQPDAFVAAGGHRTGGTRPANNRPVIACRTATRHRRGAIGGPSCRLAPVSLRPCGMPHAPVARWRFVPGMPQSVRFGRLAGPPLFGQDDGHRPDAPGSGRSYRPPPVAQTALAIAPQAETRTLFSLSQAGDPPQARRAHHRSRQGRAMGCRATAQMPTVPTMAPRLDREPAREERVGARPGFDVMPPGKTEIFKYPFSSAAYTEMRRILSTKSRPICAIRAMKRPDPLATTKSAGYKPARRPSGAGIGV